MRQSARTSGCGTDARTRTLGDSGRSYRGPSPAPVFRCLPFQVPVHRVGRRAPRCALRSTLEGLMTVLHDDRFPDRTK